MADAPRQFVRTGPLFDDGFSLIPNAVLRERRYSGLAKLTWALLYDYSYRTVEPELAELASDLGVGVKAARKALKELKDGGSVLSRRRGLGLPNRYELLEQAPFQKGPTDPSREAPGTPPSSKDLGEDEDVGAKAPTSAGGKLERRRNIVFDALVEATHANPADGGMIGKAAKSIRTAMADTLRELTEAYMAQNPQEDEVPSDVVDELVAGQIRIRADLYRRLRPDWELTPTALAKHWNRIPTWQPRGGLSPGEIASLDLDDADR